jgi:autotransporter-associated beta strand protein
MSKLYFIVFSILLSFSAYAQNSINADIVVALDDSGDFNKIQDAIDAVPSNNSRQTIIYIKRGTYDSEKLMVPSDKKNITIVGESRDETIISYHIYDCSDGKCPAEDAVLWSGDNIRTSATLTIHGDGFKAENITIRNTAGPVGQAQAITVRADKVVFINCNLEGYQDTIYLWSDGNRSYFKNCLVVGRTDYIYGGGIAFFDQCEIRSWGGGWITAPSTGESQQYGYVFYECDITYANDSPRAGDDGSKIRLGRPWHNYPKVVWLYCNMTGMIHPEGWGDIWHMDYAPTSTKLHLYEYKNTGDGAEMSGRANWAGLRALTDGEALEYTAAKVLAGNDGWDPSAEEPMVQSYTFTANGDDKSWSNGANWSPEGVPVAGEIANVNGTDTITAIGGTFSADLNLNNNSVINIAENSVADYIAVNASVIYTENEIILGGKIATKDTLFFDVEGVLTLDATLTGVHKLIKTGSGRLILNGNNSGFSGDILVKEGEVEGAAESSLGKGYTEVEAEAVFTVSHSLAFQPTSKLIVSSSAQLNLSATLTTSEFFIDEVMQPVASYTSQTNPELINGEGEVLVGRPGEFTFIGGDNGNWDNPAHFVPALLPEAGETVYCDVEMETTSTPFAADIVITANGNMRLRGSDHVCTGIIYMHDGTSFRYNTGGSGFTLTAPVVLEGDVKLIMESGNSAGSEMVLPGTFTGNNVVTALNNGKGTLNTGTVVLKGDNSGFSGVWDLTSGSEKYPGEAYVSAIDGQVENAFGNGFIDVANGNKVMFSHEKAVQGSLSMSLNSGGMAVLNVDVKLDELIINEEQMDDGIYSASSHSEWFEGSGSLIVGTGVGISKMNLSEIISVRENVISFDSKRVDVKVYSITGSEVLSFQKVNRIDLGTLINGVYIVSYQVENRSGALKHIVKR